MSRWKLFWEGIYFCYSLCQRPVQAGTGQGKLDGRRGGDIPAAEFDNEQKVMVITP